MGILIVRFKEHGYSSAPRCYETNSTCQCACDLPFDYGLELRQANPMIPKAGSYGTSHSSVQ